MSSALYPLVPPFIALVILAARLLIDFGYKLGLVDKPNERSPHSGLNSTDVGLTTAIRYELHSK